MSLRDTHAEGLAVLGGGNGAMALAGDLALRGWPVSMYEHPAYAVSFRPIADARMLTVRSGATGQETHGVPLQDATHHLPTVLERARVLHLVVPVSAQEIFYRELLPHLTVDHTVVVWAGRFGALRLARLWKGEQGSRPPCRIVEVNTLPYGSRRQGPTEVGIFFRAIHLFAAVLPSDASDRVVPGLQQLFPNLQAVGSALEAAFRNSAMPVLGVGALLNIGAIEARSTQFSLFRDGMTPTVRRVIRLVHHEMIAVGAALGFRMPTYPDSVYDGVASIEGANFRDEAGGTEGFLRLTGPDRVNHRYTVENIRYGLAVVAALGHRQGIPTPTIDTLCALADTVCGNEFARLGWSLADLGLD